MTYGELITQMAAQLKDIENPGLRRFVAESALLRGLGLKEELVYVMHNGTPTLLQDHPVCKADQEAYDAQLAKFKEWAELHS